MCVFKNVTAASISVSHPLRHTGSRSGHTSLAGTTQHAANTSHNTPWQARSASPAPLSLCGPQFPLRPPLLYTPAVDSDRGRRRSTAGSWGEGGRDKISHGPAYSCIRFPPPKVRQEPQSFMRSCKFHLPACSTSPVGRVSLSRGWVGVSQLASSPPAFPPLSLRP